MHAVMLWILHFYQCFPTRWGSIVVVLSSFYNFRILLLLLPDPLFDATSERKGGGGRCIVKGGRWKLAWLGSNPGGGHSRVGAECFRGALVLSEKQRPALPFVPQSSQDHSTSSNWQSPPTPSLVFSSFL